MKNIKRLLCVCLIACICLCAVGCNKANNNNSSGLSSTATQTETSSVYSKIESTEENTSTEESKVSKEDKTNTTESKTNKDDSKTNSSSNNSSTSKQQTSSTNSNENQSSDNFKTEENTIDLEKKIDKMFTDCYCEKFLIEDDIFYNVVDIFYTNYGYDGIITKDGSVYFISPKLPFSNSKKYKKIDSTISIVGWYKVKVTDFGVYEDYKNLFLSRDFKLYELVCDSNNNYKFEYVKTIEKFCSNPEKIIGIDTYRYYDENKIYIGKDKKVEYSFPNDEIIEYICNGHIKTNKAYYKETSRIKQEFADSEPIIEYYLEKTEMPIEVDFVFGGPTGWCFGVYKNILYYGLFQI